MTAVAVCMLLALAFCLNQFVLHWIPISLPSIGPDESAANPPPAAAPPPAKRPPGEPPAPPPGVRPVEPPDIVDVSVARTICKVAIELGANGKVLLSAYEAALVESTVRNLPYGDRDSLGVFQQRHTMGWGTREQIMDPDYASRQYISRAIRSDRANPRFTPGQLAQDVQRSAFPDRYDEREGQARALIARHCS